MTSDSGTIRATVRLSETSDQLFLVAEHGRHEVALLRLLRDCLDPDRKILRRTADGIEVPTNLVCRLFELDPRIEVVWTVETRRFVENRRRLRSVHSRVFESLQRIRREGAPYAKSMIVDSAGLEVLDQHQLVNVAAMTLPESPGLCLFDEQGVGKTVTLIFAFDLLVDRDQADLAIIFSPKSMVEEWREDLQKFRPDIYNTVVLTGSKANKRRQLTDGADVFVTNYETAVTMENELRALMRAMPDRIVLAIDESFFAKSLDAKRTRALLRLREWADRVFVLCGTPAPNSPSDLVGQFNLVDFGFCLGETNLPVEPDLAATVIQSAIKTRGLYLRHLKRDVLPELPPKRFQRVIVPMAVEQTRLYRKTLRSLVADVEAVDVSGFNRQRTSFVARRTALLQICSNPSAVSTSYCETPAKLSALDSILEHLVVRQREKVVIWSFYTVSLATITRRFESLGVVRFDGSVTDVSERREAVRRFQNDDNTMIMVANPAAAGAGLTLHRARFAIYESFSNQTAHYLQSLDRIHRRGQQRDVENVVILCQGTLELFEYQKLTEKERSAQKLLGDRVDAPLTRETFLSDVRSAVKLLDELDT